MTRDMDGPPAVRSLVVTGASGNLGTALLRRLRAERPDLDVRAVCRRPPPPTAPYDVARWTSVDLGDPNVAATLRPVFEGADAVVHLAWAIQPIRDRELLSRVNVGGTAAVAEAAAECGVAHLVHASSIGVYAPGGKTPVPESWPASGIRSSGYSRDKVAAERFLDAFESSGAGPAKAASSGSASSAAGVTVTRLRPTLVVQRQAAAEIATLFLGPLVRPAMVRWAQDHLPVLPLPRGLALQFVHADDVAEAIVRVLDRRLPGPVNLAADPLGPAELAALVRARPVTVPAAAVRMAVAALYRTRAIPTSPGWFDLAMRVPLLDCTRAERELGWRAHRTSAAAAGDLVDGLGDAAAGPSPALAGRPAHSAAGRP